MLRRFAAFVAWLEGDKHHPAVHSRTACKAGDIIHCRIVTDNFHEILQLTAHRLKRNTLIRLNPAHQHASVLLREEGFRDRDIQPDIQRNGAKQHHAHQTGMIEHPFQ
ncbi:Uncharacterised protein [Shigella sonnei]|nr:Uncharacterised protein [Shigella sonnei]CSQ78784.1 Uncharacterised protein [Shigella sonnei]CSS43176.1 Uncharacterised protein [Shigella sonnei]